MKNEQQVLECLSLLHRHVTKCGVNNLTIYAPGLECVLCLIIKLSNDELGKDELIKNGLSDKGIGMRVTGGASATLSADERKNVKRISQQLLNVVRRLEKVAS